MGQISQTNVARYKKLDDAQRLKYSTVAYLSEVYKDNKDDIKLDD